MYLFEQKSVALYYQTIKYSPLLTLIMSVMSLMKSVSYLLHQHYIDSLSI